MKILNGVTKKAMTLALLASITTSTVGCLEEGKLELSSGTISNIQPLDITQVHNNTYSMECVNASTPEELNHCVQNMSNTHVFFRVLEAQYLPTSEKIYGLGVWAGQNEFNNCGGYDLNDSMKQQIQSEEYLFAQNGLYAPVVGNFTSGANCPVRQDYVGTPDTSVDADQGLENYFCLSKVELVDGKARIRCESNHSSNGCYIRHINEVTFESTTQDGVITGYFKETEEKSLGCAESGVITKNFTAQFTRQ